MWYSSMIMVMCLCNQVPSSVKGSDGTTWSPPQPDAVDVIIARMLDATTIAPLEGKCVLLINSIDGDARFICE